MFLLWRFQSIVPSLFARSTGYYFSKVFAQFFPSGLSGLSATDLLWIVIKAIKEINFIYIDYLILDIYNKNLIITFFFHSLRYY